MAEQATASTAEDSIERLMRERSFREATARCAREHGAAVGRLCMALLGAQAEAEEALQETLLAAHDGMASYRGDGSVRAWLMGIARHLCARRLAARVRQERRMRLVGDGEREETLPDALVALRRDAERLRVALDEISPSEREVLLLRYLGELSFREVATACGIDEAAARKRASRGLERLRSLMEERR